ncbi:MAG: insulinase family protein [Alphaproteobacteria bacterium]|nr:insulinase family protein [Alphaproteobacteria bacterium]NNF24391.1 insulinase family protein [Paracoccaceae bacterium]
MTRLGHNLALALAVTLTALAGKARAAVEIQEVTSPGGITAWLVEEHTIPFTALEIRFKGGSSLDAPGKRGATHLMVGLLEEGAADRDARAFAKATEELAAQFNFDIYDTAVAISARFLTENRDQAIDLLRTALVEPNFEAESIERVRAQVVSIIQGDAQDPSTIARTRFDRMAFGDHPFGSPHEGTLESLAALTRNDLVDAHDRALAKDRLYIGAVGDITPEELGLLLDRLLGDLPDTGAEIPEDPAFALDVGLTVIPFQTPQSVAFFGHEGITRDDPDFFAAYVVNEIFGGSGFQSRLMQEVREKRGLTYGIGSYLASFDEVGMVLGQVATANDRMAETVSLLRDLWAEVAETGVTQEELDAAKTYVTGAYPLRFDGNATIARIMVGMQTQELPIDYIATRNDKINAVTLEDVNRVAKRIYRPEDLHVIVVGQPDGLPMTE